ncbi:2602_t:CDS:1 [Dentiscutata heterogama]|uniref:2602_t:CDS:1 n=1 Tax=Dentiscutata heterogama TaxID=1316150 RepID=A0ACA9M960_9GLOM|nr:2602_t:CDS:1 [Dentiscutata heterogama]
MGFWSIYCDGYMETKSKKPMHPTFYSSNERKKFEYPDPGERFSYVVVKGDPLYDENGKKQPRRVADYMEFPDNAKELNTEIDISHYLEQTVGLCARFINDNERYQPPSSHKIMQLKDSDEKEKHIDAYSQKEAKKWLTKYIKALK